MPDVLVVDDDPDVREMVRQMLLRKGYSVRVAGDGAEGLKLFKRQPADLIVLDIVMPEMEGLETILELKREFPDVRIIAMSGGGRVGPESYTDLASKFGAQRTFKKPLERDAFLAAVEELVGPP